MAKKLVNIGCLLSLTAAITSVAGQNADENLNWSCEKNWIPGRNNSRKCYQVFPFSGWSWSAARALCGTVTDDGAHLALIDSHETQTFLVNLVRKHFVQKTTPATSSSSDAGDKFAFIGLTNIDGQWLWSMDAQTQDNYKYGFYPPVLSPAATPYFMPNSTDTEVMNWADGEPSASSGGDSCGAISTSSLYAVPCSNNDRRVSAVICEAPAHEPITSGLGEFEKVSGDVIVKVLPDGIGYDTIAPLKNSVQYFENGVVPYVFDDNCSPDDERRVKILMDIVSEAASQCVRFVSRTSEADYVKIVKVSRAICASDVGRMGGAQSIIFGPACLHKENGAALLHEMLHAIGLPHEHQRADRDNYIVVNFDNIVRSKQKQFEKFQNDDAVSVWNDFDYDYESIMHYRSDEYSFFPGKLTTIEVNASSPALADAVAKLKLAQTRISTIDRMKLRKLYCESKIAAPAVWKKSIIIPYRFYRSFAPEERAKIRGILDEFSTKKSCVKWQEDLTEQAGTEFVKIISRRNACVATVGKNLSIDGTVYLDTNLCLNDKRKILKLFMNVLGFRNEHTRADRDKFVKINWQNIQPNAKRFFQIDPHNTGDGFDYDYASVLQYGEFAYSSNGAKTIEALQPMPPGVELGQNQELSATDVARIDKRFRC